MKPIIKSGLECIRSILSSLANGEIVKKLQTCVDPSCTAAQVIAAATPSVVATGGAVAAAGAGAVLSPMLLLSGGALLGYMFLTHRISAEEAKSKKKMQDAIQSLLDRSQMSQSDAEFIARSIHNRTDDIQRRLDEFKELIELRGADDTRLLDYFARHEGLFVSLADYLETNQQQLIQMGLSQAAELKGFRDEAMGELKAIRSKVDRIDENVTTQGEQIARILELAERNAVGEEALRQQLTGEIEKKYAAQLAQERDARLAAERAVKGLMAVKDVPGIVESLREKGGKAILQALQQNAKSVDAQSLATHRQIAEWAYLVGEIEQAERSLNIILAAEPNDLDAINRLGHVHMLRDPAAAEAQYRKVLSLAGDDESWKAAALGNLGLIAQKRGDLAGAEQLHWESLEIEKKLDRLEGQAAQLGNLGLIARTRGDLAGAEQLHRESLEIEKKLGRLEGQAVDLGNLGLIARTRGDLAGAEQLHREALEIEKKLGRREGQAAQLGNLGLIAQTRGDLEGAEQLLRESLEIDKKLGRLEGQAAQLGNLGLIAQDRGDLAGAEQLHRQALEINKKLGRLEGQAKQLGNLGAIAEERNNIDQARQLWTQSRDLFAKIGMSHMVKQLQGWLDGLPAGK